MNPDNGRVCAYSHRRCPQTMCTQPAVHESMLPHSRTWLLCKINQNPFQKYGCFATKINTQLWTRSAECTTSQRRRACRSATRSAVELGCRLHGGAAGRACRAPISGTLCAPARMRRPATAHAPGRAAQPVNSYSAWPWLSVSRQQPCAGVRSVQSTAPRVVPRKRSSPGARRARSRRPARAAGAAHSAALLGCRAHVSVTKQSPRVTC